MNLLKRLLSFFSVLRNPEVLILMLGFAGAAIYSASDFLFYTPDSARYVIWANSIAKGDGFSDYTSPEPKRYVIHAPFYSVVLSPVAALFRNNIIALKLATAALAILLLLVLYSYVRSAHGRIAAFLGILLLALNPLMMLFSTQVLSEVLFALSLMILFHLTDQWTKQGFMGTKKLVGIIVALLACIFSREIGVVLLFVMTAFLLIHKRYENAAIVFLSVVAFYLIWFFRNEIFVAGAERPELRNMTLFVSHILTSNEQSMWNEFALRISVNSAYYLKQIHSLLFFPQFTITGEMDVALFPIVDRTSAWIGKGQQLVSFSYLLLIAGTAGMVFYGVVKEFQKRNMSTVYMLFLLLYIFLILVYPVYDIRFLFPLLLVMILFFCSAAGDIVQTKRRMVSTVLVGAVVLCMIPNALWGISFVTESHNYQSDQIRYYRELKQHPLKGTDYTKPFVKVAEWFKQHPDTSQVIISRWKELGIAIPEKKVLLMDVFVSLTMFEQSIRDYDVKYIVTSKDDIGWHGYEFQMNLSQRYSFILVHSVADFDIYEVREVTAKSPRTVETAKVFQYMFSQLRNGQYDTLNSFFSKNASVVALQPYLRFYSGVSLECAGELDSALAIYEQLYRLPQGIAIGQQLGFHRNVIDKRKSAERSESTQERAALYLNIALNYWELDLRHIAFQFLDKTLFVDSNYIPAYSLSIYFSLVDQDTAYAKKVFTRVQKQFPHEVITSLFSSVFSRMDSLKRTMSESDRSGLYIRLSGDFKNLGLSESALEAMRNAYMLNKRDVLLSLQLSDQYEKKSKFYPSLVLLNSTNSINPQPRIQKKIGEIVGRY